MDFLNISLISSTLFCTLVAGFVLLYAIVVMPGLSKLNDKEFLRAFQVTDGIIQNNQPIFIFVWIGSIISVICLIIVSIVSEGFFNNWVLVLTGFTYLLGVQGITILIHIPLNNNIKKMKIDEIGLYEVNEAFAPVPLAWEIEVGADQEKLNVNGGAMALGHPLGATGAKLMTTLIYEMHRRDVKYGLQAICEGGGTANATILEKI